MKTAQITPQAVEVLMLVVPCPLHHEFVAVDTRGHIIGRCNGCARAAALGIRKIEQHEMRQTETTAA